MQSPSPPEDSPAAGPSEGAAQPGRGRALAGLAAAGTFLLLKLKGVLALLKAAPLGKLALTSLSMLTMVAVEARRGGLGFAVGFVLLIFLHEIGHAVAIRRAGLDAGWPVFIPFVGAMISLRGHPPSAAVEADIAYAGPVAGTAASLACAALYFVTGSRLLLALAYTGFFMNLFNLVPISPLDGGRVAEAFSRRAWILGGALLGGMFMVTRAPQLLLIGGLALMRAFGGGRGPERPPLDDVEQRQWMSRYFGLCFFLGAAIYLSKRLLSPEH